ncbi:MAG: SprT family zinc-dependent metalloprotease [Patescibacteria group bacterium]
MPHAYTLIRSRRRSIALTISRDATLVVRAPLFVSKGYIDRLVEKKGEWIEKKQEYFRKRVVEKKDTRLMYLGEVNTIDFKNKKETENWYKKKAREILTERIEYYSKLTGWTYRSMSINGAKTRWGSCGPRNTINFSWRLVMAPLTTVDYVIVHELAHIVEKNHSKKFWDKVREVMPDYKERQAVLKSIHVHATVDY